MIKKLAENKAKNILSSIIAVGAKYADINGDGKIDINDLKDLGSKIKNLADLDKNGVIDISEKKKFRAKLKMIAIDALITIVIGMALMYSMHMSDFSTAVKTTIFWTQFGNISIMIAGFLGFREKYSADIAAWVSKAKTKDDIIADKDAEIAKLKKQLENNAWETQKAVMEQEKSDLKEQIDALKTNLANAEAIINQSKGN